VDPTGCCGIVHQLCLAGKSLWLTGRVFSSRADTFVPPLKAQFRALSNTVQLSAVPRAAQAVSAIGGIQSETAKVHFAQSN